MKTAPSLPQSVLDAFQLMWGNFPEPASLVHKSREVMAANSALQKLGLTPGMNCAQFGDPAAHKGCLAAQALASGKAMYSFSSNDGKDAIGFWLPLEGYPEYFVHFGVGYTIDYRVATAQA